MINDDSTLWSNFAAWWVNINGASSSSSLLEAAKTGDAVSFCCNASQCWNRRIFVTAQGYVGLGPQALRVGDSVYVLCGGYTPFILRPKEDHYQVVGAAYVDGLMQDEAAKKWHKGKLTMQDLELR